MTTKRKTFKGTDLAGNLKLARQAAKMSQALLAETAGIGRRSLQEYERSEASPTVETLEKIARALDIPASELLK